MKIKSEYELAHVVSTGLARLSNQVQNGATETFRKFKDGDSSIIVTIGLTDDGEMTVTPYEKKAKIKALEKTVKTQEEEIKSLEPQIYTSAQAEDEITIVGAEEPKKPKPRRRET